MGMGGGRNVGNVSDQRKVFLIAEREILILFV